MNVAVYQDIVELMEYVKTLMSVSLGLMVAFKYAIIFKDLTIVHAWMDID
jgi:hypothetical protein